MLATLVQRGVIVCETTVAVEWSEREHGPVGGALLKLRHFQLYACV